jgi:hypothetical protein
VRVDRSARDAVVALFGYGGSSHGESRGFGLHQLYAKIHIANKKPAIPIHPAMNGRSG